MSVIRPSRRNGIKWNSPTIRRFEYILCPTKVVNTNLKKNGYLSNIGPGRVQNKSFFYVPTYFLTNFSLIGRWMCTWVLGVRHRLREHRADDDNRRWKYKNAYLKISEVVFKSNESYLLFIRRGMWLETSFFKFGPWCNTKKKFWFINYLYITSGRFASVLCTLDSKSLK